MKNAVGYLIEPLLTQFFLIDAICRGFISETQKREIFNELAKIFCVPLNRETEEYYSVATSSHYNNITDYATYERLCRLIEFAESSGQTTEMTLIDRVVLAKKREAMLIKSEIFKQSKNLTADIVADTLLTTATNGNVDAMVTLAYMEYHGVCICKDAKSAKERLALCAKWNNLFGNLMGIAYDARNKENYYDILHTVLKSSNQREVFKYICEFTSFDKEFNKCAVASIIEKAFSLGIIRKNVYDQIFAKVAFSPLISAEDKEKLLLNKKKDAIVSLSDIPFDVDRGKTFAFDESAALCSPLHRDEELHQMFCSLSPALNNRNELYQTLLVANSDEYISDMYLDAIKAGFEKTNKVIELDASTLSAQDFAAAKENFILRGLSETKDSHTVFLVKHCDELRESELDEMTKLLDHEHRRKFKLMEPTVSLDLSDVLIILFASEVNENVKNLSEECDVVWTERLTEDEKKVVIESTFNARSKSFGIERARLDEDGMRYLAPFRTDYIIRIIDSALKKAAYDKETVVTAKTLRTITEQQNFTRMRREFGYLGGFKREEY
jgi:hypothetical protein